MSLRRILTMAVVTMGVMYATNYLASVSPMVRRVFRSGVKQPVTVGNTGTE